MHLLATLPGVLPATAQEFRVAFAREAQVSLILVAHITGQEDKKVKVVFPGETSPPISLAAIPASK